MQNDDTDSRVNNEHQYQSTTVVDLMQQDNKTNRQQTSFTYNNKKTRW